MKAFKGVWRGLCWFGRLFKSERNADRRVPGADSQLQDAGHAINELRRRRADDEQGPQQEPRPAEGQVANRRQANPPAASKQEDVEWEPLVFHWPLYIIIFVLWLSTLILISVLWVGLWHVWWAIVAITKMGKKWPRVGDYAFDMSSRSLEHLKEVSRFYSALATYTNGEEDVDEHDQEDGAGDVHAADGGGRDEDQDISMADA